jgi:hypothetical protein
MKRLRSLASDLWVAEDEIKLGVITLPIRMTVIRLKDGGLWILSPIPLHEDIAEDLASLGEVRYLVAPNLLHHLSLGVYAKRYPQARTFAPADLTKKRPDLTLHATLEDPVAPPWANEIEFLPLQGMPKVNEFAFFHPPSETLIVTDLVFNLQQPRGFLSSMMFRMLGTYKRLAFSRLLGSMIKDKRALGQSCEALFGWAFSRLIMAHGEIVEENASPRLRLALEKLLRAASR